MVDGLGRIFVSNAADGNFIGQGSLTVFSPAGTLISTANASRGYLAGGTIANEPFAPTGMGIDPSGNVWITGVNTSGAANAYGYVTELIGIAAPVVTPTSVASSTNRYGSRP
jgi:sugar lactone lactonase YvrE